MQKNNRSIGVLTAIIVGALVAVGVQAFSTPQSQSSQPLATEPAQGTIVITQATIVPMDHDIISGTPVPITIGDSMPEPPTLPSQPNPTAQPLADAPAAAALAADETLLLANDFRSADMNTWQFDHVFWDPLPAPTWTVKNDEYATEVLVAPDNHDAITPMNDTMAFAPITLNGNGGIEVSAMANSAEKIGLVVGDVATKSYAIIIFSTQDSYGFGDAGVSMLHIHNNSPLMVVQEAAPVIEPDQWYRLRLDVHGDTIQASIDGKPALTANLPEGLSVRNTGVFAGSEGYAFFDNLNVFGK